MAKECKGRCPCCDGENIHYGTIEVVDEMIYYPAECLDCKKTFKEYYNVNYCETIFEE